MSTSDAARKHTLECMRLRLEVLRLADAVENPDLRAHFEQMAKQWLERADQAPFPN